MQTLKYTNDKLTSDLVSSFEDVEVIEVVGCTDGSVCTGGSDCRDCISWTTCASRSACVGNIGCGGDCN